MGYKHSLYHYVWIVENQQHDPHVALQSPLLALNQTSDVNPIKAEQIMDARQVLRWRRSAFGTIQGCTGAKSAGDTSDEMPGQAGVLALVGKVQALQKRIVERFLEGRRAYFGAAQSAPLECYRELASEGRDIFIVVKLIDEEPHIATTLHSILNQRAVDLRRIVIVVVDNNSIDGSTHIVNEIIRHNKSSVRILHIVQSMPGGGNAARLGVDRSLATLYEMCCCDGKWERLQDALIGVSDGDTVYHQELLGNCAAICEGDPNVDGVMPFLTYKLAAGLRLYRKYERVSPCELSPYARWEQAVFVPVDLFDARSLDEFPRPGRKRCSEDAVEFALASGGRLNIALASRDALGRPFGILKDREGHIAYVRSDRTLVLDGPPVSDLDTVLMVLENGIVCRDEKWRWHSLTGLDLFLRWAFQGMGVPEEMVYPDTSDALKLFRAWSFAVGGQHQLSRPDLRIVTGTDYQSGRVLQIVGAVIRLGPADAYAETETDRLCKMIYNLARDHSVLYGETRSTPIERASGLYLHMTRIQDAIENEIRQYPDEFFRDVIFPERFLFPLRWMLQNALRFYAHWEEAASTMVRRQFLDQVFACGEAEEIEREYFGVKNIGALRGAPFHEKQALAEKLAETIIVRHYGSIMRFYTRTLESFFAAHGVAPPVYAWLLCGLEAGQPALSVQPRHVHPSVVWRDPKFIIDDRRGQVVGIRNADNRLEPG